MNQDIVLEESHMYRHYLHAQLAFGEQTRHHSEAKCYPHIGMMIHNDHRP